MPSSESDLARGGWPAHGKEVRPWHQRERSGTQADRTFSKVEVALPPYIAGLDVPLDARVVVELESALGEIVALDRGYGDDLEPLTALLLRTESVASSKIERISASSDDYARASYGIMANASAVAMVAATRAVEALITTVGQRKLFELVAVESAHAMLMADDAAEQRYAGRFRTMQNWIGGSDHSPRGALYVPPPPELVEPYMADLLVFVNRDDVPVLAQAAIAHAQFESIHPFTDGNGRIGRALVNAVMRRRGTTTKVVVPLASALVAHRDRYFDALNAYRAGDHLTIISEFASASRIAAVESQRTAERLSAIPAEWRDAVGPVRSSGALARLLQVLPSLPAFMISDVSEVIDASESSIYTAVERLQGAGVIRPVTDRRRNQIWGASAILDELEDLSQRIEAAAR